MRPTNAQILEGRDEALEHLHIDTRLWDDLSPRAQREVLLSRVGDATSYAATRSLHEGEK